MKKIISTVLALTMVSNIAMTAMADDIADAGAAEAVIEVTDGNSQTEQVSEDIPEDIPVEETEVINYTDYEDDSAELFGDGTVVLKQSPDTIEKVVANIEAMPTGTLSLATHQGENFRVVMNSNYAEYEYFSIEEEDDGNKFVRMAADQFIYQDNPSSMVEFTPVSAKDVVVSYRVRFSKYTKDWLATPLGSSRADIFFINNKMGMNYGYGDFKNGTGNVAAYKARYQELYGKAPSSQEWDLVKPIEEGVWYNIEITAHLDTAANGGQCYDLVVKSDDNAESPVDIAIDSIPFRTASGSALSSIGTLRFIAPHLDNAWVDANDQSKGRYSQEYAFDIDDMVSYAVPEEAFYFDVTGPETLSHGLNTIVTSYDNRLGSDKNVKEYIAISEDGVLKEVVENTFFASGEGKDEFELIFDESAYTGEVTYDVFVLDGDTGANLAVKAGEGGTAPSGSFVTTELGYGRIIANVASTDTYNAGFVTVRNSDGDIVYMADADFAEDSSVEYIVPEETPEGNFTFEVTVSNADGDAKTETAEIEYRKDAFIIEQFNAENADIGALIAAYGEAMGLDLSGEYATKAVYMDNIIARAAPFADADAIRNAFAEAEAAAAQISGDFTKVTIKESGNQISRNIVDFENFPSGSYDSSVEKIDNIAVNKTYPDYASSDIISENGNKYIRLTQEAGYTVSGSSKTAINLACNTEAYPSNYKGHLSYKMKFDTLSSGWHVFNVGGQLASLYMTGKKFGINYGANHASGLAQEIFSGTVQSGVWYEMVFDIDYASKTFNLNIYNEDGTLFATTESIQKDCPFRSNSNSMHIYIAASEPVDGATVDSVICVDDITSIAYDPNNATVSYKATGTKDLMPGENVITVDLDSLLEEDEDIKAYIPVYIDGQLVDIVTDTLTAKAGKQSTEKILLNIPDEYLADGAKVSYELYMLEKLGGYNYTAASQVTENSFMNAALKADFDEKQLNITSEGNLDNAVVMLLAPGKTLADAEADPVSSIIYMSEETTGIVDISIPVPDSFGAGEYTAVVSGQDASGGVFTIESGAYYCGNEMVDTIIADFNAVTAENVEAVINKYLTEYPVLSAVDAGFASYYEANKDILNRLAVEGKPYAKVADIIAAFNKAYAIDALKAAENEDSFAEIFEDNASSYGIDVTSGDYENNKSALIDSMYAVKDSLTVDNIKATYDDILVVVIFNQITKDTAADAIETYADILGLDLTTEYAEYPKLVIAEFVKAMPYADKADIQTAFDNAVAAISMLDGDYTETVIKQSVAQEASYAMDFNDMESPADLDSKIITYAINDTTVGSVEIAQEADGNKYFLMKQEDGYAPASGDAYAVGAAYKGSAAVGSSWATARSEAKIGFSYKIKFEGVSTAGWTYLQINNLSSLYITGARKFGINGSGSQTGSFGDISVEDGKWYNIDYVIDFNAKTYDLTITDESGKSQTLTDRAFRGSATDIAFAPWTDQYKNNGAKSYVAIDDITTTVMANKALTYTATGTKDLLPGENVVYFDFNNTNIYEEAPVIYIPIYVNGVLDRIVTDSFVIAAGETAYGEVSFDIDSALLADNDVTYDVLVLSEVGGFNYTPENKLDTEGNEASITASFEADFDSKLLKIATSATYLDNMTIAILGPDKDLGDANADPDANVVYLAETDAGEIVKNNGKETSERTQAIEIDVDGRFGSGIYTLVVSGQDINKNLIYAEVPVYYSGDAAADEFVADFNNATEANIEAVVEKYLADYPILTAHDEGLPAYYEESKDIINATFLDSKPYAKPTDIINTVFSVYYAAELIAAETEEEFTEVFEANAHYFGISFEDGHYEANKAEVIDRLYADKDDITATGFKAMYDEALMIARFNSAGTTTIESVLNDYSEVLGLDFDKTDYTDKEYLAFRKELTKQGLTYDSVEDILNAYDDAVDAAEDADDNFSSGGGSGGGGSSKPNKVVGGSVSTGSTGGTVNVGLNAPYVESDTKLAASATGFVDLIGVDWAIESINALKNMGVVNGVDATHFNPNANVTREEFAKMIVAAFKVEGTGKTFADAPQGQWYTPFVNALASAGIADGVGNGSFGVGQTITRQDAAVILDKASQYANIEYEWDVSALYIFTDYVADYAKQSIQKLYQAGVINGTSATTFSSTDTLTRAQAAKMIYYMLQLGNK